MAFRPILVTKGKELKILKSDGNNFISKPLYIDGEVQLKTNSNFSPIWKASSNSLLNLVSSSFSFNGQALPSGQFPMQGVQIWESTEPLNFSVTASLYMGDGGGRADVFAPAIALMSLPLPKKATAPFSDILSEKFNIKIETLIPPGPNIKDILKGAGLDIYQNEFGNLHSVTSGGVFTIVIADYVYIPNTIIKGVDCNFSSTLDDLGYPTSCEIQFEFTTMEIATGDMMNQLLSTSNR